MKKDYKHLVFDFDGTLADSSELLIEILRTLSQKHRLAGISLSDFQNYRSLPMGKKAKILPMLMKLKPEITALYGQGIPTLSFFPGVLDTLTALHARGFALAVLSSNETANIARFLEAQKLPFQIPAYSSQGFFGKHSALKKYGKMHGCTAGDILYIGDEMRDVDACAKAEVDIAFVGWGLDGEADLGGHPVAYRLKTPSDLLDIV